MREPLRLCFSTPRLSGRKLLGLLLLVLVASGGVSLVDAQWTKLWEYIPTNSVSASQQAQPLKRAAHSLVAFQDFLYVFGGIGDTNDEDDHEFDDTWRFDLVAEKWTTIYGDRETENNGGATVSPQRRFHQSTALHTNATVAEMVIFGGLSIFQKTMVNSKGVAATQINITQFNDVWRLSLDDGKETWRNDPLPSSSLFSSSSGASIQTTPAPRSEAGAVAHDGQLYMFGGISYDDSEDALPINYGDLWRYNLSDCTWHLIVPTDDVAPQARFSHSLTKVTDEAGETFLVVFSGRTLELQTWSLLGDTWVFALSTQKWSRVQTSLPVQRAYTSLVATPGSEGGVAPKIWFFGGYFRPKQGASGYVYDDVVSGYLSTPGTNTTTATPPTQLQFYHAALAPEDPLPPLRYNHRAVLWRDAMVIHGGSYQSQRGDVWMFNLTSATMRKDSAVALPVNMETLVYVLAGFVVSILIVLAVLIIRWRGIDRRNLELARLRGVSVMRGVPKERLDQMAITKYKKPPQTAEQETRAPRPTDLTSISDDDINHNNEDVCPICLIEFEEDEEVRNLPCKHLFHVACIDEWLGRNTTCPMCKNNLDLAVVDVEITTDFTRVSSVRQPTGTSSTPHPTTTTPPAAAAAGAAAVAQPRGGAIVTPVASGRP